MPKRFLPSCRSARVVAPAFVVALLAGCGASQPAGTPQASLPGSTVPASAAAPQPTAAAPAPTAAVRSVSVQWRYQCPTPKGVEWLLVTYHGPSPEEASALTLQRGDAQSQFSRAPLPGHAVFLAKDEDNGYRWLLADNGQGSLRVRAANRTAVETPVLSACQPTQSS